MKSAAIIILFVSSHLVFAQTGRRIDRISDRIKPNVVRIRTADAIYGTGPSGFGIIIRENQSNKELNIITAAHVILDAEDEVADSVKLQFYRSDSWAVAEVLKYDSEKDLALLKVRKPRNVSWYYALFGKEIKRHDKVWFVGRGEEWYVPTIRYIGAVNKHDRENIVVDMIGAVEGSSGAPLVSRKGIIGMLTKKEGESILCLSISRAKEIYQPWLGTRDFKEIGYPAVSFSVLTGMNDYFNRNIGQGFFNVRNDLRFSSRIFWGANADVDYRPGVGLRFDWRNTLLKTKVRQQTNQDVRFRNEFNTLTPLLKLGFEERLFDEIFKFQYLLGYGVTLHNPEVRIDRNPWTGLGDLDQFQVNNTARHVAFGFETGTSTLKGFTYSFEALWFFTNARHLEIDEKDPLTPNSKKDRFFNFTIRIGYSIRKLKMIEASFY